MPKELQEIPSTEPANKTSEPIYCLLQDDKLITSVKVTVDRFLSSKHPSDIFLMIHVNIKATKPIAATIGLV